MLVSPTQSHFKFDRFDQSPTGPFDNTAPMQHKSGHVRRKSYHRRTVSCLAIASQHEHFDHPSYSRLYDTIEIAEGSASPVQYTRHTKRKSEGAISLDHLQKSLSNAGASANKDAKKDGDYTVVSVPSVSAPLGGKLVKLNVTSPVNTPRRSLLSDLLNNQGTTNRFEQNVQRRRMLKSMRRYSVDASEMDFNLSRPSSRVTPMQGIPAEDEAPMLMDARQGFSSTPTVRYLRNPCHATIKTKLPPSAYRGTLSRRGGGAADEETPDYFGTEDRVW
ncbi:hypothetical protein BG011_000244 [Mortierella polycephala]|uniref:Uncharacterized protein n=1 Tax=Mortierella polycephala TaxID=41804 RepID=A0A9P6Q7G9_9FUNG|nr:hypothetical protein BG011_000244 [Mortierella polycephala]